MSTRFQARKQQFSEAVREAVNWLFLADLDTMAVSISETSGIVKIDLGLGRRNPALYRNEIEAILDKSDEIRRYLEDHPAAKNTPPTKRQQQAMDSITNEVMEAKRKETYREALVEQGLTEAQCDAAVVKKFGSV